MSELFPTVPEETPAQGDFMEAAGIEPARPSPPQNGSISRGFAAKTTICGISFEVARDDRHLNLHLYEEGQIWRYEPLEQAIPKLEAILAAARLAANVEVLDR